MIWQISECIVYVALCYGAFRCALAEQEGNPCWSHLGALLAAKINFLFTFNGICQKCGKTNSSGEGPSKNEGIKL